MSLTILCVSVVIFYAVLWFFDSFFKSCMHYPYFAFLEGTGLKIGFLSFSWTTAAFNRCIYRWSKNLNRILRKWFTCGYLITLWIFLPFSIWTLFSLIFQHFAQTSQTNTATEVKAMLPGVNIPVSDFWIYFVALALSSILHELGHAMAAVQDDVQLLSVGVYIFTIIPVAFVQLNTEVLNSLTITKRLKIYCAGVWHNIAFAAVAVLIFFLAPVIFNIGYESDVGVHITDISDDSPLGHVRGLDTGDTITSINRCNVKNAGDWHHCLQLAHNRYGICTSAEYVAKKDENMLETIKENDVVECCSAEDLYSFCFEYMEPKSVVDSVLAGQYSCLKPREMIKKEFHKCTEEDGYTCENGLHCLRPSLNNRTYLIVIERKDNNAVLFLGYPYDVYSTVQVDQYFPRIMLLSFFSPMQFEKFLQYIVMFSSGIAFLNVIPCYGMDGHHIARVLIQLVARYFNKNADFVSLATIVTVVIGTGITFPTMLYLFYKAVYNIE